VSEIDALPESGSVLSNHFSGGALKTGSEENAPRSSKFVFAK
jgi:hypothetical protein